MRRNVTVLLAAATLFGGALFCQAMAFGPEARSGMRGDGPGCHDPFQGAMARGLDLSEDQQKQIAAIFEEQRGRHRPEKDREAKLHDQLHQLELAATFDEQAVKAVANSLAALEAERVVARARTHAKINAVLTPAQRALAEKMRPQKGELPPLPRGGCGPEARGGHGPGERPDRRGEP